GSLAVAAILLYTAPAFVTVISAFLFKEKLTKNKLFSLLLMFSGCVFVSGVFSGGAAFSVKGILLGLGSGIGYAMYSIFGRYAINRGYKSETISFYTFVFCLAGALFICDVKKTAVMICSSPRAILLSAGIGFICCVLPYVFYTKGLETTENSTASILATAEPLVASLIGIFVYKDSVTVYLIIGIILMITGIITMNLKKRTENDKTGV
ncbi:MAG: DMT family transporter, partial [Acutalibacteraceae bacterium]